MTEKAFIKAREEAKTAAVGAQDLNQQWWENLPMTYIDWDSDRRLILESEAFKQLEDRFLSDNPWLSNHFDFSKFKGTKVLEVGCGAGSASVLLAKSGAKVTAVDITENAVKMTRLNAEAQDAEIEVIRMDAEKMDFPPASFDYIFSWGVLHHSSDPLAAFKAVGRVLKPGGGGLIMVYNRFSLRYYIKGLIWLLFKGKVFKGHSLESVQSFFTDGYFHKHFTPKELAGALGSGGLKVTKTSITHMSKKMLPLIPTHIDEGLKAKYGWLLVAEFVKAG